ncbi:diguanylate cyclase [filamentous cyanobacterium CCP5]|nr:diguanylate cyclase [filamentous cyanobacterium CCP5]
MSLHQPQPLENCLEAIRYFFQNSEDAVIVFGQNYQILTTNIRAQALFINGFDVLTNSDSGVADQLVDPETSCPVLLLELLLQRVMAGEVVNDVELLLNLSDSAQDIWLSVSGFPITNDQDQIENGVVIIRDISDRRSQIAQQLQEAQRDLLTGLPNRSLLVEKISQAIAQLDRAPGAMVAVIYFDVERFKAISDTFGHIVGNGLLLQLVNRIQACLVQDDLAARIGRDEFVILLTSAQSQEQLLAIVEHLIAELSKPFTIDDHEISIRVKIGIDLSQSTNSDPEDLMANAGTAMSQAKQSSSEQYCIFNQDMRLGNGESLRLELDLRRAIRTGEMVLHYQPIVIIKSREIVGFEALVRWNHPVRGLLSPNYFIPIAEETGLIIPLGWWVLRESCRQLRLWRNRFPQNSKLFVSVNMSSQQFAPDDTVEMVQTILQEEGIEGKYLKIEITEGVLIAHSESIIKKLGQLREMGIQLSIDDFGTGYSSLSYLHQFPFDTLKLDRSFIEGADSDYEKLEIMQSVVRLAWNLGLEVVAEGIETQKHYAQLRGLRCELGQGYLFSRPLAQAAAEDLLLQSVNDNLLNP